MAILQSLVSVVWADGEFQERERQMLDALLESFGASDEERAELDAYAAESKTLEDIPITMLSHGDRRQLLQHAVMMSWVDGEQSSEETELIDKLCAHLHIGAEEAASLRKVANERAQAMLELLKEDEAS
jgi:uncharacterized tellurite resistance protein B-like protein